MHSNAVPKSLASLLALACLVGCGNIDSASRCQLDWASPDWTNNSLTLKVTNPPKCPVSLDYPGTLITYAGTTTAPEIAVPAFTIQETRIFDAASSLSGQSLGTFAPIGNGQTRSNESGSYNAGQASTQGYVPPIQHDQANTAVPLSFDVGGGTATGAVLLPYTLTSVSAARTSVSALRSVKAGATITVRAWEVWYAPSPSTLIFPPPGTWYFDGVKYAVNNPKFIGYKSNKNIFEYSVSRPMNARGVHSWKFSLNGTPDSRTLINDRVLSRIATRSGDFATTPQAARESGNGSPYSTRRLTFRGTLQHT